MTVSRAQAGYTLTEVMIVVAVIGILAAVGIPSFMGVVPRIKLGSNVTVLANEIALVRVRAISKSTDFRVVFDTAGESCTIEKYQAGAWKSLGDTKLNGSDLYTVAGFTAANTLVASANGQVNVPLSSQANIEVRTPDGVHRKRIVVESTGRLFVQKWSGSTWVVN